MLTFAVHIQNHLSYTPTQEKIARKKLRERKSANDQSPNFSIQPRLSIQFWDARKERLTMSVRKKRERECGAVNRVTGRCMHVV